MFKFSVACGMVACILLSSCKEKVIEGEPDKIEAGTPVTIAQPEWLNITDSVELNATSDFLLNNYVKAPSTGYIRDVYAVPGEYVDEGKILFTIETKESIVIGKSISSLDTNFKFNGISKIVATGHGYITQLNHQQGDYVQDGELLAVINSLNSFVFLMNLPYAWKSIVHKNQNVELTLPDGSRLPGLISSMMPSVDSASQSQVIIIKVNISKPIPQNLIATVRVPKETRMNAQMLLKSAVLSDESQTHFWVMKLIDSVTAARVEINKGMEWKDRIEILSPVFSKSDQIIVSGNYGLPDTARVIIQKP
jgi:hypothetical protein